MTYDELLVCANNTGLVVKEQSISGHDGLIKGNRIAIRKTVETTAEKSCVLAEELGHYYTTSGDILDQSDAMNRKQEYRARQYGYNLKIGLIGIVRAFESGCKNLFEMADYLEVTEEYLSEALKCYKAKYGLYTVVDNYIIYFEPSLTVARIIE